MTNGTDGANESAACEPPSWQLSWSSLGCRSRRAIVVSRRIRQELGDPRYPAVNPLRTCSTAGGPADKEV
jgi:hypothetical protein